MAENPRKPTRAELALFLPDQRSIRAFEKIFDLLPTDIDEVLIIAEIALDNANQLKTKTNDLQNKVFQLEAERKQSAAIKAELDRTRRKLFELESKIDGWLYLKTENAILKKRLDQMEAQVVMSEKKRNLQSIIQRIENIEALEGIR